MAYYVGTRQFPSVYEAIAFISANPQPGLTVTTQPVGTTGMFTKDPMATAVRQAPIVSQPVLQAPVVNTGGMFGGTRIPAPGEDGPIPSFPTDPTPSPTPDPAPDPTPSPTPDPTPEPEDAEDASSTIDIWDVLGISEGGVLTSMPDDWVSPYGPNDNRPRVSQWRSSADFWPEDHEYAGMTIQDQVRAMYDLGPDDRITLAQRSRVKRMRRAYDRNFSGLNQYLLEKSPTFADYIDVAHQAYDQLVAAGFEEKKTTGGRRPSNTSSLGQFRRLVGNHMLNNASDWGQDLVRIDPNDRKTIQLRNLGRFNFVYAGNATYEGILDKLGLDLADWEYRIHEDNPVGYGEWGYNDFKLREDSDGEKVFKGLVMGVLMWGLGQAGAAFMSGVLSSAGMSAAAASAIGGAVGQAAATGVVTGDFEVEDLIVNAAKSYFGAQFSGISGAEGIIADVFEGLETYGPVAGMSYMDIINGISEAIGSGLSAGYEALINIGSAVLGPVFDIVESLGFDIYDSANSLIINLVGDGIEGGAGEINSLIQRAEELGLDPVDILSAIVQINDIAWQEADISDILGDVQVGMVDYRALYEEIQEQEEEEGGGSEAEAEAENAQKEAEAETQQKEAEAAETAEKEAQAETQQKEAETAEQAEKDAAAEQQDKEAETEQKDAEQITKEQEAEQQQKDEAAEQTQKEAEAETQQKESEAAEQADKDASAETTEKEEAAEQAKKDEGTTEVQEKDEGPITDIETDDTLNTSSEIYAGMEDSILARQIHEAIRAATDPEIIDGLINEWENYTGQQWDDSYLDEDPYEGYEQPPEPEIVGYVYDPVEGVVRPVYQTPEDGTTVYETAEEAEAAEQADKDTETEQIEKDTAEQAVKEAEAEQTQKEEEAAEQAQKDAEAETVEKEEVAAEQAEKDAQAETQEKEEQAAEEAQKEAEAETQQKEDELAEQQEKDRQAEQEQKETEVTDKDAEQVFKEEQTEQQQKDEEAEQTQKEAEAETQQKEEQAAEQAEKDAQAETEQKEAEAAEQSEKDAQAETEQKEAQAAEEAQKESDAETAQKEETAAEEAQKEAEAAEQADKEAEQTAKDAEAETADKEAEAAKDAEAETAEKEAEAAKDAEAETAEKEAEEQQKDADAETQEKEAEAAKDAEAETAEKEAEAAKDAETETAEKEAETQEKDGTGDGDGDGTGDGTGDGDGDGDGDGSGIGLGGAGLMATKADFKPFMSGISYTPVQIQEAVAPQQRDYMQQLEGLIGRSLFGRMI